MEDDDAFYNAKKIVDQYVVIRRREDGTQEKLILSVERDLVKKPFLGGYKSKETGAEYHHASSQTENAPPPVKDNSHLRNRDTQTFDMITRSIQTYREMGTQMKRSDLHMEDSGDTFREAGPYFTAAGVLAHKRNKAITIQRYWRGYLARSLVWYLQNQRYQAKLAAHEKAMDEKERGHVRERFEMHRRMQPRSKRDFEVLYNELEQWRKKETQRAKQNTSLSEEERQAVYDEILDKETKVLQTIDRLKIQAGKEWKLDRQYRMMQLMALPKKWQMGDGELADVHTAHTIRAQELLDLYKALNTVGLGIEERLDVLLHVKWTVSEFPCPLTQDIIDLIDREADLLNRGRRESSLEGLRQRLSNLFLDFIKTPNFNYEANRFVKVQKHRVKPIYPILLD